MEEFDKIISKAIEMNASDIHITSNFGNSQ